MIPKASRPSSIASRQRCRRTTCDVARGRRRGMQRTLPSGARHPDPRPTSSVIARHTARGQCSPGQCSNSHPARFHWREAGLQWPISTRQIPTPHIGFQLIQLAFSSVKPCMKALLLAPKSSTGSMSSSSRSMMSLSKTSIWSTLWSRNMLKSWPCSTLMFSRHLCTMCSCLSWSSSTFLGTCGKTTFSTSLAMRSMCSR
mmetsp:Transcript_100066/g.254439  ORF Transcript_100066/g.254439 Transcript_100066/m.254439 type:complete len:200 (+) Transcript_100066:181-780(+)